MHEEAWQEQIKNIGIDEYNSAMRLRKIWCEGNFEGLTITVIAYYSPSDQISDGFLLETGGLSTAPKRYILWAKPIHPIGRETRPLQIRINKPLKLVCHRKTRHQSITR